MEGKDGGEGGSLHCPQEAESRKGLVTRSIPQSRSSITHPSKQVFFLAPDNIIKLGTHQEINSLLGQSPQNPITSLTESINWDQAFYM